MKIDVIGTIYSPTGNMISDGEGGQYPEIAPDPGWHVNTPTAVGEWSDYKVSPATPRRQYAGGTTVYYTFPEKATFDAFFDSDGQPDQAVADSIEPPRPPVPDSVTKRQAKEALIRKGLYQTALTVLDNIADPAEKLIANNYWAESQVFEKENPVLRGLAFDGLKMTEKELEDLLIYADTL